jgi:hypothetical protein
MRQECARGSARWRSRPDSDVETYDTRGLGEPASNEVQAGRTGEVDMKDKGRGLVSFFGVVLGAAGVMPFGKGSLVKIVAVAITAVTLVFWPRPSPVWPLIYASLGIRVVYRLSVGEGRPSAA